MVYSSPRLFRVWEYRSGHNMLLIRSPMLDEHEQNIDLVFWGVDFMQLRSSFAGLSLRWEPAKGYNLPTAASKAAILESDGDPCVVVAAGVAVYENKHPSMETRLDGTGNGGKLLARRP